VTIVLSKLDTASIHEWQLRRKNTLLPTSSQIEEFLLSQCIAFESSEALSIRWTLHTRGRRPTRPLSPQSAICNGGSSNQRRGMSDHSICFGKTERVLASLDTYLGVPSYPFSGPLFA